jgi:hypothetical protein
MLCGEVDRLRTCELLFGTQENRAQQMCVVYKPVGNSRMLAAASAPVTSDGYWRAQF